MYNLYGQHLQLAQEAALKAGDIIIEKQGKAEITEKGKNNLVTEADYDAEELIINMIRDRFPNHQFMAEETDLTAKGEAENLWIIDPLDGTNNYAHSIPHFSVSIAYASLGRVMVGVVYDPVRKEMFTAIGNQGAYLNKKQIQVSQAASLQEAIIATGFYYDRGVIMRKTLTTIEKLFDANIHGIRRFGSAALDICWVACGRFDAFFEYNLSTWDFAAGMLILEEAGGCINDHNGNRFDLNSTGIIASNGRFHETFLDIVIN